MSNINSVNELMFGLNKDIEKLSLEDMLVKYAGFKPNEPESGVGDSSAIRKPDNPVASVENNNPGNLRAKLQDAEKYWTGVVDTTDAGFVVFDSPQSGNKALTQQIRIMAEDRGQTFGEFADIYTPIDDDAKGNRNLKTNIPLMMRDKKGNRITLNTKLTDLNLEEFRKNMVKQEGGQQAVDYFYQDFEKIIPSRSKDPSKPYTGKLREPSSAHKKKIMGVLKRFPENQLDMIQRVQNAGYSTDWIDEEAPWRIESEFGEFKKGVIDGLTFGLIETDDNKDIFAGDIDTQWGSFSPSKVAGTIAGSLPYGLGSYAAAGKIGTKIGLSGKGRTAFQLLGGEGSAGFGVGYYKSDGKLDEAVKQAAIWTSMGLMGEGLFAASKGVFNKLRKNKKLNDKDKGIINSFNAVKERVLRDDNKVENIKQELSNLRQKASEIGRPPLIPPTVGQRIKPIMDNEFDKAQSGQIDIEESLSRIESALDEAFEGVIEADRALDKKRKIMTYFRRQLTLVKAGRESAEGAKVKFDAVVNYTKYNEGSLGRDKVAPTATVKERLEQLKKEAKEAREVSDPEATVAVKAKLQQLKQEVKEGAEAEDVWPEGYVDDWREDVDDLDAFFKDDFDIDTSPSKTTEMQEGWEQGKTPKVKLKGFSESDLRKERLRIEAEQEQEIRKQLDINSPENVAMFKRKGYDDWTDQEKLDFLATTTLTKEESAIVDEIGMLDEIIEQTATKEFVDEAPKPRSYFNQGLKERQKTDYDPDYGNQSGLYMDEQRTRILEAERKNPISPNQVEMIVNLQRASDNYDIPIEKIGDDEIKNLNSGEARVKIAEMRNKVVEVRNEQHQKALADDVDIRIQKDMPIQQEVGVDYSDVDDMSPSQKAYHEQTKERASKDKSKESVKVVDGNRAQVVEEIEDPNVYREPGLLWWLRLLPATARRGLSANPLAKARVLDTIDNLQIIGRDTRHYLDRFKKAIQPLYGDETSASWTEFKGVLGSGSARETMAKAEFLKRRLVEALDSDATTANRILTDDPELVNVYSEVRGILDELADFLNLSKNARVTDYFPHIFGGNDGRFRANRVLTELGRRSKLIDDKIKPFDENEMPTERFFSSLKRRTSRVKGEDFKGEELQFESDLETVMYSYIRGAVDKKYMDPLIQRVYETSAVMPKVDPKGNVLHAHEELNKWFKYVLGQPTKWKTIQSMWWKNNDLFNKWVDNAVEWLGDSETKGLLGRARSKEIGAEDEQLLTAFFNKLIQDSNEYSKPTSRNIEMKGHDVKKYRAQLALMIDDIRSKLIDPSAKPVVLEKLYQIMVVNKLGFSISHGLINTTGYLTNTIPVLGARYSARGVKWYAQQENPASEINGIRVSDILDESGIITDLPQEREFTSLGLGLWDKFDEIAMTPATVSENFLRTSTFMGGYEKAIVEEGLDHIQAMAKARALVDKTMFVFNRAGTPVLFQTPFIRFLLMFKSFTIHQTNFTAELLEDAIKGDPGPFIKHMLTYITMAGAGLTILGGGGLNIRAAELAEHPLQSTIDMAQDQSTAKALGGPTANSFIELLHGNIGNFADDWGVMASFSRIQDSGGDPIKIIGLR
jgi:hypothetical protein